MRELDSVSMKRILTRGCLARHVWEGSSKINHLRASPLCVVLCGVMQDKAHLPCVAFF